MISSEGEQWGRDEIYPEINNMYSTFGKPGWILSTKSQDSPKSTKSSFPAPVFFLGDLYRRIGCFWKRCIPQYLVVHQKNLDKPWHSQPSISAAWFLMTPKHQSQNYLGKTWKNHLVLSENRAPHFSHWLIIISLQSTVSGGYTMDIHHFQTDPNMEVS